MKKLFFFFYFLFLFSCMSEPRKQENTEPILSPPKENIEVVQTTTVNNPVDTTSDYTGGRTIDLSGEDTSSKISAGNESIITLRLLEKLIIMSPDEFKNWASLNGYSPDGIDDYEVFKVMSFRKSRNFISYALTNEGGNYGAIVFETADGVEYNNIKNSGLNLGYKFRGEDKIIRKSGEIVYMDNYKNGTYELSLYLTDISNHKNLGYSITFKKL